MGVFTEPILGLSGSHTLTFNLVSSSKLRKRKMNERVSNRHSIRYIDTYCAVFVF